MTKRAKQRPKQSERSRPETSSPGEPPPRRVGLFLLSAGLLSLWLVLLVILAVSR